MLSLAAKLAEIPLIHDFKVAAQAAFPSSTLADKVHEYGEAPVGEPVARVQPAKHAEKTLDATIKLLHAKPDSKALAV